MRELTHAANQGRAWMILLSTIPKPRQPRLLQAAPRSFATGVKVTPAQDWLGRWGQPRY